MKGIWKDMNLYRRVMLVVMTAMIVGFGIATPVVGGRKGLQYGDSVLQVRQEGDKTIYYGTVDWEKALFTVTSDGEITYTWGDYTYGPYRVIADPSAAQDWLTGFELYRGEELLFRGSLAPRGSGISLFDEQGEPMWAVSVQAHTTDGTLIVDGRVVTEREQHEPGVAFLARLVLDPQLTHRGSIGLYLMVTLLAAFNIVQILFPEALFKLSLWGHVRDVDSAEPSEWYIACEYMEWAILAATCLFFYWQALTTVV